MDQQVKISSKVPIFNGEAYAFWSIRMRSYIMSIGLDIWMSIQKGYIYPKYPLADIEGMKQFGYNAKVVNTILVGLARTVFAKVMHCKTIKEIWDKLQTIYEGYIKVKRVELKTFKNQFESLKMKEEEKISEYLERIDEIVNAIQGIREELKEKYIL